jgi:hypothetical protein
MEESDDSDNRLLLKSSPRGETLLPGPVASTISLAAKSSSLWVRVGLFVGGLALDSARATTLAGVELGRNVAEAVLSRAGRDIVDGSRTELGRAEAESILERTVR